MIYERLLENRIIFIEGQIATEMSNAVIAQLLYLESESQTDDIHVYINSPGGYVTDGMAIYDTMQLIKPDVSTICVGQACSMGAIILSGGARGKRFGLPHSQVMIHQPLGGMQGQASDILIHTEEIVKTKEMLNKLLAKNTKQNYRKIIKDTDRDNFMTAIEAKKYGLIDKVLR